MLFKIFKKISMFFDENKVFQAVAHLQQGQVVDVDETLALYAGKVSIDKKLPMADALIYPTAILRQATVYTLDAHFAGWPQVKYF